MEENLFIPTQLPFPKEKIPKIIYEECPRYVKFWNDAWEIAWKHVYESKAMPNSPYLGEGCGVNKVWIWDTCFMTLFSRYSNDIFPTENTLNNFYDVIESQSVNGIYIHHPDNPPLFAWAEYELYKISGNLDRVKKLLSRQILQKHYYWLENDCKNGMTVPWGAMAIKWEKQEKGYLWAGCPSGMDNTPRGNDDYTSIYWLDALSQQALSALYISKLANIAGDQDLREQFCKEYNNKKELIKEYFDTESGCYFDRYTPHKDSNEQFCKVLTPASFWPLFAQLASEDEAAKVIKLLEDDNKLGGIVPLPTVSRDSKYFEPQGKYWRGSVWLPVFYMAIKGLENYNRQDLAKSCSIKLLNWMIECYDKVEPHTIWECYSPTQPYPAEAKTMKQCRKDFCGWSALAPISLMLENVIGLNFQSANDMLISWNLPKETKLCGIKNLQFGDAMVTILADSNIIQVETTKKLTLNIDGTKLACPIGKTIFTRKN